MVRHVHVCIKTFSTVCKDDQVHDLEFWLAELWTQ
jgi:hypothetical protein